MAAALQAGQLRSAHRTGFFLFNLHTIIGFRDIAFIRIIGFMGIVGLRA